jgi:hypothetical protein
MKRSILIVFSLLFVLGIPLVSSAGDVHVSIGIPAPFVFAEPPDVVVVPSDDAYIYMVPDTPGLYFYNDWWYRFDSGRWYRSRVYNGRWAYIDRHRVPRYVVDVPPDYYRHLPREYHRIHYGDLHKHWRKWGRDRYWNRYDWYKRQHREHRGGIHDRNRRDGRWDHDGRDGRRGDDRRDGRRRGDRGQRTHPDGRDMGERHR